MYCSIRNFNEYDFSGDISNIEEFIYDYEKFDMLELLELTKQSNRNFVFRYYSIPEPDVIKDMENLCEARDNVRIMFCGTGIFESQKFPYFYDYSSVVADSIDSLRAILELGVSDVYITGELGFRVSEIRHIKNRYEGCRVRVMPNIATISGLRTISDDGVCSFWIRPEDLERYEECIDCVEFFCKDEKQRIFYDVYFQDKHWHGDLSEIIVGLESLDNRYLSSIFGENRFDCKKKCLVDRCHKCYSLAVLADMAKENEVDVKKIEESI